MGFLYRCKSLSYIICISNKLISAFERYAGSSYYRRWRSKSGKSWYTTLWSLHEWNLLSLPIGGSCREWTSKWWPNSLWWQWQVWQNLGGRVDTIVPMQQGVWSVSSGGNIIHVLRQQSTMSCCQMSDTAKADESVVLTCSNISLRQAREIMLAWCMYMYNELNNIPE